MNPKQRVSWWRDWCTFVCVIAVSYRNPQAGQAAYAGVFDSCSYGAAAIEPFSPEAAVHPLGRLPLRR